jgi:ketosteroid isomerase-like protein
MSQENVEIIKRLFAARASQDLYAALSWLAEDVELDASKRVLDPMVVHGRDRFIRSSTRPGHTRPSTRTSSSKRESRPSYRPGDERHERERPVERA